MNRDKRGGRKGGEGSGKCFRVVPLPTGIHCYLTRAHWGWAAERRGKEKGGEREREREGARKGKHCWNLCKIRSSWTPRVRVLDIQRVFLTRYHPFLPFLFFFSLSFFPGCRNYPRFDASRIFDQSPLDGWINGISKYGNVFHSVESCYIVSVF